METPIKMDDLGVPLFSETSIYPHNKRNRCPIKHPEIRGVKDLKGALFAWQLSITKDCPAGRRDLTQGDLEIFIHPGV